MQRLIQWVVRELKCSPLHALAALRAEIQVDLHGRVEIDRLILHAPARQAGAAGDQRDIESTALLRSLLARESFARIAKVLVVARVASKKSQ